METGNNIYTVVAAGVLALPAILSYVQARKIAKQSEKLESKVDNVHNLVNSGLTRLVEATADKYHAEGKAEGILEGVAAEKARQAQLDTNKANEAIGRSEERKEKP